MQIDDPDLPTVGRCAPRCAWPTDRKLRRLRGEAINHALRDVPEEQVRLPCAGAEGWFRTRTNIDLATKKKSSTSSCGQGAVYSIEAANDATNTNGGCKRGNIALRQSFMHG